jgi:hypothetical protein
VTRLDLSIVKLSSSSAETNLVDRWITITPACPNACAPKPAVHDSTRTGSPPRPHRPAAQAHPLPPGASSWHTHPLKNTRQYDKLNIIYIYIEREREGERKRVHPPGSPARLHLRPHPRHRPRPRDSTLAHIYCPSAAPPGTLRHCALDSAALHRRAVATPPVTAPARHRGASQPQRRQHSRVKFIEFIHNGGKSASARGCSAAAPHRNVAPNGSGCTEGIPDSESPRTRTVGTPAHRHQPKPDGPGLRSWRAVPRRRVGGAAAQGLLPG